MIIRNTCVLTSGDGVKGWYILILNEQCLINCNYYATINFYSYILNFDRKVIESSDTKYFTEILIITTGLIL